MSRHERKHSKYIKCLTMALRENSPNKRKYGPEITPYLDTFHAVDVAYDY